jgi:hypothetical protein
MGRAKEIIVKVIPAKIANEFVKKHHYSGKVATTSNLHFGCFLDDKMHGVLSYGNPIDKRKVLPLVQPCLWNEMLELNRMAFDDYLPKNSESRCIAISIKLIKKYAPQIKWILSFSDGTQCGDGTIYRASGFFLTAVRVSKNDLYLLPDKLRQYNDNKDVAHRMTVQGKTCRLGQWVLSQYGTNNIPLERLKKEHGGELLNGFQLRYIYLIDKSCKITVPILPFSDIDKHGAGMYKGKKISLSERKALSGEVVTNPASDLE